MKIETPFKIGQKVWIIDQKEAQQKCPICDGTKQIIIKKKFFYTCPECLGDGYVSKKCLEWYVKQFNAKIREIIINEFGERIYLVGYEKKHEKYIFATRKQAQQECDKRNKGE